MIVAIIGVMLWMDVRLTLVTLLTVPMLFAATTWFRKGARRGYDMCAHALPDQRFLQEHFAGPRPCKIFNAEKKSVTRFKEINADYRKANIDTIFYYAVFFPLVDFIGAVGIALIIWYGGYRVMQNALTLGALVAFIQYSGFLFNPFEISQTNTMSYRRGSCFSPHLQKRLTCQSPSSLQPAAQSRSSARSH